jgi:putative phosphoribosyl transferase
MAYRDRTDAGRLLAAKLAAYATRPDVHVLALPGAGVGVALEVACALDAPLEVCSVSALGAAGDAPSVAGSRASVLDRANDDEVLRGLTPPMPLLEGRASISRIDRQTPIDRAYFEDVPVLRDRVVILVDDGRLAAGPTLQSAVRAIRRAGPHRLIVALPVGSPGACEELEQVADEVVCALTKDDYLPIEQWYRDTSGTRTEEATLFDSAEHGEMAMSPAP